MRTWQSRSVVKVLGVSPPKLNHWLIRGVIEPEKRFNGRGGRHEFSLKNIIQIAIAKELCTIGITDVHKITDYIRAVSVSADRFERSAGCASIVLDLRALRLNIEKVLHDTFGDTPKGLKN